MHNLKLIQQRFPQHGQKISRVVMAFAVSLCLIGLGLLLLS